MIEKPPLDDDLLIHFGVKGMKWGRRKARPDEAERKQIFKSSRARKIAIGAAAVGGALAVGYLMTQRGRIKVTDMAVTNYVQGRQARVQAGQNPFGNLAQRFRDTKAASVPAPDQLIADARMAGVRDKVFRESNQKLTDKSWRDAANFRLKAKEGGPPPKLPSIEELRERLAGTTRR